MTNTTRQLTFRSLTGYHLLRVDTDAMQESGPRFALRLTTQGGDRPGWSYLTPDQVEELNELTGLILADRKLEYGDDGVQDARIVCGARHGERLVCILDDDHAWPAPLGPHGHISADGTAFLVNPDAADLPH